jgi:ATP-binding cassette subfamily C protein
MLFAQLESILRWLVVKYKCVLQQAKQDCGAACTASIFNFFGYSLSLSHARLMTNTRRNGTTLKNLKVGAEKLGFTTTAIRVSDDLLSSIRGLLPAIIHWEWNHFVVLYKYEPHQVVIGDPAVGIRKLSTKDFHEGWTKSGILVLKPDPNRISENDPPTFEKEYSFFSNIWKYSKILVSAFYCSVIIGFLSLAMPLLIQILTDEVLVRKDSDYLNKVAVLILTAVFVSGILRFIQGNLIAQLSQHLELDVILQFCYKILHLPISYFETHRSGEIISRLEDIQEINQLLTQIIVILPSGFFIAAISLGLMLRYSIKLTGAAVLIIILSAATSIIIFPYLMKRFKELLILESKNHGVLVEAFRNALTLKTIGGHTELWAELQSQQIKQAKLELDTSKIGIFNTSFSSLVSASGRIGLLWYGSLLFMNGELRTVGQLLAFYALNNNIENFVMGLVGIVDEFVEVRSSLQRASETLNLTDEVQQNQNKESAALDETADIKITNLTFRYNPITLPIFENFSLDIPGGKVTALIGDSGCGKSTLSKLIANLYSAESGNISLGSYTLRDISQESWRSQVTLIPQEAQFWKKTVIENLRLASSSASLEEIVNACGITGADSVVSKLPYGYNTELGEYAVNLSTGQRQRLSIARAILNDPPVLILDESTSGLDQKSEHHLLKKLLFSRCGKTTVIISHRLYLLRLVEHVVLLDEGDIKWQGDSQDFPQ